MRNLLTVQNAISSIKSKATDGQATVGGYKIQDKTLYINFAPVGFGGIVNLIDSNTVAMVGITNIDGQKLNAGKDFVIDSIALKGGFGSTIKNADYSENQAIDSVLKNAELIISQGKKSFKIPVSDVVANPFTDSKFLRILLTPILINSNQEFKIQLELPKGETVESITFCRLELTGFEAKL